MKRKKQIIIHEPSVWTADAIYVLRDKTGLAQDGFGAMLGVTRQTIHMYETDKLKPSPAIRRLLDILDKHPEIDEDFITTDSPELYE